MQVYPQEKTTDLFAGFIATTVSPETNVSSANHNLRENSCKPRQKCRLNSPKKITHVDDMMIHNFVKYVVQTRLHL